MCGAGIPNNQTHTIDFQFHETGGSFTNVHGPRPIESQFSSLLARTGAYHSLVIGRLEILTAGGVNRRGD